MLEPVGLLADPAAIVSSAAPRAFSPASDQLAAAAKGQLHSQESKDVPAHLHPPPSFSLLNIQQ